MDEMIDMLRNKTSLCRFTRGEVKDLLEFMKAEGMMAEPAKPIETMPAYEADETAHD